MSHDYQRSKYPRHSPKPHSNASRAAEESSWSKFATPVSGQELNEARSSVFRIMRYKGYKNMERLPGPQPASLSRNSLETLRTRPFMVLEKSDGERCMMFITEQLAFVIDRKFACMKVDHAIYSLCLGDNGGSLLDGEMILDADGAQVYLIYDIVQLNGSYVGDRGLRERLAAMQQAADIFAGAAQSAVDLPFVLKVKRFLPKNRLQEHLHRIRKLPDGSYQYEDRELNLRNQNDGLIFTPEDEPYFPSSNVLLLKWKWPDLNSIDFKVNSPYFDRNGLLELWCGYDKSEIRIRSIAIDEGTRAWLNAMLDPQPNGYGVVECVYDANLSKWLVKKIRPDKNIGNYITTVMSTLETIIDNVQPQELCATSGCPSDALAGYSVTSAPSSSSASSSSAPSAPSAWQSTSSSTSAYSSSYYDSSSSADDDGSSTPVYNSATTSYNYSDDSPTPAFYSSAPSSSAASSAPRSQPAAGMRASTPIFVSKSSFGPHPPSP